MRKAWLPIILLGCGSLPADESNIRYSVQQPLVADSFDAPDTSLWVVESEERFRLEDNVRNGALDISVSKGITIWNTTRFHGDVMFEYAVTAVRNGGPNDRVSDLNCFWMAADPEHPEDFFARSAWRSGVFHRYYSLKLYYAGYGGHDNTRTRFRKYNGVASPQPAIIREYTDAQHLLEPNRENVIRIVCFNGTVSYYFNDGLLFELDDPEPYTTGYFGFRTTNSHLRISDFRAYALRAR